MMPAQVEVSLVLHFTLSTQFFFMISLRPAAGRERERGNEKETNGEGEKMRARDREKWGGWGVTCTAPDDSAELPVLAGDSGGVAGDVKHGEVAFQALQGCSWEQRERG